MENTINHFKGVKVTDKVIYSKLEMIEAIKKAKQEELDKKKKQVEWYLQETKKPIFPKDNRLYDEWVRSKSKLNYKVWLVLKAFEDVM